jgi:hypothetical protein
MAARRAARRVAGGFAAGEELDDLIRHQAVDARRAQRCRAVSAIVPGGRSSFAVR